MRIALGGYRGRLTVFFQDRAHILMYRRPYCIKCLFVNFRHLWLDVDVDCRSPCRFSILRGLAKVGRARQSRDNDSWQLQGRF